MFIRKQGRQRLILASYRDAQGRVRQRRLGAFRDRPPLERHWRELGETLPLRQQDRLTALRLQAEALLEQLAPPRTPVSDGTRRATRSLLNLLSEQPQLELSAELRTLRTRLQEPSETDPAEFQRSLLSPRRRSYWANDAAVRPYVESLQQMAEQLKQQGEIRESLALQQERMTLTHGDP